MLILTRVMLAPIVLLSCLLNPFGRETGLSSQSQSGAVQTQSSGNSVVKIGVVLPQKGGLAEMGAAMRDVLAAYFDELNSRGGINNRRVELHVAETGDSAAATAANARRLIEQEKVFAFVGGMSAGADAELSALARETGTPFVGPATLTTQTGQTINRNVFYLLPGLTDQARALVNFHAQSQPRTPSRVVVVHLNSELTNLSAAAVEEQCVKVNCGTVQKVLYERGKLDAVSLVKNLNGAPVVFFFGLGGEESAFIKEAADVGWSPNIFLLGTLTGRDLTKTVPLSFKERVLVAFPAVPSDITSAGKDELRALQEKYKFAIRQVASQIASLAAAKVFVEGLRRSGQDLSREKLIASLEGLSEFETTLTPRITFGQNRRVGANGAYILKIDPEKKEFVVGGGWVNAF